MNDELMQEACRDLQTLCDFVRFAASQFEEAELFYGHGTDNAWDEAAAIILALLLLPPDSPAEIYQSRLVQSEKQRILAALQKRINERLPAAYITKEAWFAGMSFYVDERVIVPRSPIAELIQNRFSPWTDNLSIKRIADVCTGSACIACALAEYFPEAQVDAIDLSRDALDVAELNIEQHGFDEQVQLINSDLLTEVLDQKYDMIISNPPYVSNFTVDELPAEYQAEPELALRAGDDGLILIEPLLVQAKACLQPDGFIVVEVGLSHEALIEKYPEVPFLWLEFERGGEGVFLLTAEQLNSYF